MKNSIKALKKTIIEILDSNDHDRSIENEFSFEFENGNKLHIQQKIESYAGYYPEVLIGVFYLEIDKSEGERIYSVISKETYPSTMLEQAVDSYLERLDSTEPYKSTNKAPQFDSFMRKRL